MPLQNLKDNNQQTKCKRMSITRSWFYTANESGKTLIQQSVPSNKNWNRRTVNGWDWEISINPEIKVERNILIWKNVHCNQTVFVGNGLRIIIYLNCEQVTTDWFLNLLMRKRICSFYFCKIAG